MSNEFDLINEDKETAGRIGLLKTSHGEVKTPLFLPVATLATVKTMDNYDLKNLHAGALIANAFLLYLRPGLDTISKAGGLHKFMNWDSVLFTDSGGYQMIRRDFLKSVDMNGVKFNSPYDGDLHEFTPEKNMEVQLALGSDIIMVQDDCPPAGAGYDEVKNSNLRTLNWAERCKTYFDEHSDTGRNGLFGIVQGGIHSDLREQCLEKLNSIDFDGYAIGGLSIGESKSDMYDVLKFTTPKLPSTKPRYLMGVGSPEDILDSIALGVDIFDSVFPTRNARHSTVYTTNGKINLNRSPFRNDLDPIDSNCKCFTCSNHTRAYVHHLLRNKELLGIRLTTLHNLHFLIDMVEGARIALSEDDFDKFRREFIGKYKISKTM
jgi:queuine tRNA-ribosyltransferase